MAGGDYVSQMNMPLLAIDTSGARLQLGLASDGEVLTTVEACEKGHAEILFDRIDALLGRAGLVYADLARIAAITGPGSFSGLRIGLAAARGLGLALGVPVIGVPRLLALSLLAKGHGPVGIFVDARRGEAYCEVFEAPGLAGKGPCLLPAEQARAALQTCAEVIETAFPDIGRTAQFAAGLDPESFPPVPAYVRDADAKPQHGARIARIGEVT